jgi:hypothetical protein
LCFDGNLCAIPSLQFLHNIPYVDFHRALAHIQVVGHYFVRLTLLDSANDRKFAACERPDRWRPLSQLVARVDDIQFSEALAAEGALVFAHACKLGLEGIVSKRASSLYRSQASRSWLKCRNPEFVRT